MENSIPRPWPDPDKPGNRLLSTYILGGLDITGSIELHANDPVTPPLDISDCSQNTKK